MRRGRLGGERAARLRARMRQTSIPTIPRHPLRDAAGRPVFVSFDHRAAEALADEVDVLIARKVIDSRSPAADALLDYREIPRTDRSDRIATLEWTIERQRVRLERARRSILSQGATALEIECGRHAQREDSLPNDGRVWAEEVRQLEAEKLRLEVKVKELAEDADRWRSAIAAVKAWTASKTKADVELRSGHLDQTLYYEVIAASSKERTDG